MQLCATLRAPLASLGIQGEGWVAVGGEQEGVAGYPHAPASHTDHEVEQLARVAASEEDREPCDHDAHERGYTEEYEHYVVRDREKPLHEREPAVQIGARVGVGAVDTKG